jgi:hypothetical protein
MSFIPDFDQMGYPVEIHFGVRKGESFQGHCWVTMRGESVRYGRGWTIQSGLLCPEAPYLSSLQDQRTDYVYKQKETTDEKKVDRSAQRRECPAAAKKWRSQNWVSSNPS